jgi:dihydroxyacetone kinase-like predicted kinase
VKRGDAIALLDGRMAAARESLEDAMSVALGEAAEGGAELVTVYLGADAPKDARERLTRAILAIVPGVELEFVDGGQPHYPYILGIE